MKLLALWWKAVRPFAFPASIVPVLLGTAIAAGETGLKNIDALGFLLTLIAIPFLHCAGNLINDYFDFQKGVDTGTYGSRGVLVTGEMTLPQMRRGIFFFLAAPLLIALFLTIRCGYFVLILGGIGALLAVLYTARPFHLKYRGLGDIVIVLAFGPLVVLGSYMVQIGTFSWTPVWFAIPITFLVDAILHANNTRDMDIDRQSGIVTFAGILGPRGSERFYDVLVFGAYISVVLLVSLYHLTPIALVTFLTLPLAWKLHRLMLGRNQTTAEQFAFIDARTAQLHLLFGVLLTLSLLSP